MAKNQKNRKKEECYNKWQGSRLTLSERGSETLSEKEWRGYEMLSARQYEIVALLRRTEEYVTVREIAEAIGVSQKTVRNDLSAVRNFMKETMLGKIESKAHVGIRLEISQECWEKLEVRREESHHESQSDQALVYRIVCELLKKNTVSYSTLEKQLFITRSVIDRLFPRISRWFKEREICLEKERGAGLTLMIPYLKRRYIWSAATVHLATELEIGGFLTSGEEKRIDRPVRNKLYSYLLDGFDLSGVIDAVQKMEKRFGFRFTYEGFQQITLMVAVSVQQIRRRMALDFFAICSRNTDSEFDEMTSSYLISRLERNYGIVLPMTERDYIVYAVELTDIQGFTDLEAKQFCQSRSLELCRFTVKVASFMEDLTGRELRKDDFFVESLFLQLRSMIGRCKYEVRQKNPLAQQVRQKYGDIFVAIHGVTVFIEKELGILMNVDETCSLVLLLCGTLLRSMAVINACVVSNYYGLGSAHLLKERLEREVRDLNIVGEFSLRDLEQIKYCDCELIISSLPIENPYDGRPVVLVEDMLLDYDVETIEGAMRKLRKSKMHGKSLKKVFSSSYALFREEFIWMHMKGEDRYSVIEEICSYLSEVGFVTEKFVTSVISREKKLPTEIGQRIAIPHGSAAEVVHSVAAIACLDKAICWGEGEMVDIVFLLAFNPDESPETKDEILRFYKKLVDLLEEPQLYRQFREVSDKRELVRMMNAPGI